MGMTIFVSGSDQLDAFMKEEQPVLLKPIHQKSLTTFVLGDIEITGSLFYSFERYQISSVDTPIEPVLNAEGYRQLVDALFSFLIGTND